MTETGNRQLYCPLKPWNPFCLERWAIKIILKNVTSNLTDFKKWCGVTAEWMILYIYLWAGIVEKSLGEVMDCSGHCLIMLLFFPPSFSWDICFVTSWQWRQLLWKTHKGAGTVNTSHPDNYGYSPNDCNFWGDNGNRQRRSETWACTTSLLKFQITNEVTWGGFKKW